MVRKWSVSADVHILYEKSGWFSYYETSKIIHQRSTVKANTKEKAEEVFQIRVKAKKGIIQKIDILSCVEINEPDSYTIAVTGKIKFFIPGGEKTQDVTIKYEYPKLEGSTEHTLKNYAELNYKLDIQKYPGFKTVESIYSTAILDDIDTFILV